MLKRTHEAFAGVCWLGGTLGINLVAYKTGNDAPVNAFVALTGTLLAIPFSAGKNSPDIDHMWWPGFPKKGYPWNSHRGITHRFWFATLIITPPFLILAYVGHRLLGFPIWVIPLFFALPAGWWSHLFGDMIYGRLRVCGRPFGLGWTTGGMSETGKRKYGGKRYVIDPAAKFCTALTIVLAACHLFVFTLGV